MDDEFKVLDELITGRVDPHIYAFKIPQIPDAIKIGDTTRPVGQRLEEWKIKYPGLESIKSWPARVDGTDYYFRDYSVHEYITETLHRQRVSRERFEVIPYSEEFFKNTSVEDIRKALDDIADDLNNHNSVRYKFYNIYDSSAQNLTYERNKDFPLRDNQNEVVDRFEKAVNDGRTNLLMYATMRFGKSFTAMNCALRIDAKLVVIVSGKADVKDEWKKTVEEHVSFTDFEFLDTNDLNEDDIISNKMNSGVKVALFLTLQDIEGDEIKERHKQLFSNDGIDLLIVDETHFGARAEEMSKGINDDFVDIDEAESAIKVLKRKFTLHLSGTPYQILMGDEFKNEEDIIATCQFSDIMEAQEQWNISNIGQDCPKDDWENPYYGFPTMIRFAFNPPESTIEALRKVGSNGLTYKFSSLFSVNKGKKTFVYENEVLNLLKIVDGSKHDDNVFSFLNYEKIKNGNMCRHMVFVLPSRAACDALEILIKNHKSKFINLNSYTVINISGTKISNELNTTEKVKSKISNFEKQNQKTITLTVKRMLTGSTIPEWDTMVFLKDTESPQEYDQAIYRIQNQYVKTLKLTNVDEVDGKSDTYKINMKEQTLLVDFDPNRMFRIQERRSLLYNIIGKKERGNTDLEENIKKDLKYSPIIQYNANELVQVEAQNVIDTVRNYNNDRGIREEVDDIPIDLSLLDNDALQACISRENEIDSKKGINISANKRNESIDTPLDLNPVPDNGGEGIIDEQHGNTENRSETGNEQKKLANKMKSYYAKILLYAFLTDNEVKSFSDIVESIKTLDVNKGICNHIGLAFSDLKLLQKSLAQNNPLLLHNLDNKIHDMNSLSKTKNISDEDKVEIAIKKFGKLDSAVVMTPSETCDMMVKKLPDSVFKKLDGSHKLLEIASTAGEFAAALKRRMTELGLSESVIKDSIYVIPKNLLCYELIKKVYKYLNLSTSNIATFTAEELLSYCSSKQGEKVMYSYDSACKRLTQKKNFAEIKLEESPKEDTNMIEFNAIVGNPPYQEDTAGTSDNPIYNRFMDIAYKLSNIVVLITPARFLTNAGKTPKDWNKKMLNDPHFKVLYYERDSRNIFSQANFAGGVVISYYDKTKLYDPVLEFTSYDELNSILHQVYRPNNFDSIMQHIYLCLKFDLKILYKDHEDYKNYIGSHGKERRLTTNIFETLPDVFNDQKVSPQYIGVYGLVGDNERILKWIDKKYISENKTNLDFYKVCIPKSYGGPLSQNNILIGPPFVAEPKYGHTQTFISFGCFDNIDEANSLLKYVKTKFFRIMLAVLKTTQDNNIETWKYVPWQNFKNNSDIHWNKTIPEIDRELYKKYNLSDEAIKFIEDHLRYIN